MGDILSLSRVPVIFLSAYGRDKVVTMLRAALRGFEEPRRPEATGPFVLGDLTIDYAQPTVSVSGRPAP